MSEITFIIEEAPEGGFIAKGLNQGIFTQADSVEELKIMIKDAVLCHFDEGTEPKMIHLHFIKDEVMAL